MVNVLLVNDHPPYTGIGKYWHELYKNLPNHLPEDWVRSGLMQNMGGNYSPSATDINVQFRPKWCKQVRFGKWYNINSYYYYPHKIPATHSLYHISSQMMGQSVRFVNPAIATCHDLIAYEHADNLKKIKQWIQRKHIKALRQASGLIFISEHSKNSFLRYFDYPDEKTVVIYHGTSSVFHPRDKSACRAELELPEEIPIIIAVGSESERKNLPVTLQVIQKLRSTFPDVLLIRIGGQSRFSREYLKANKLEENVCYKKHIPEETLAKYYNAADLLIFPSTYEGFGLPVIEAMSSGLPVITSNVTSLPEIVGDTRQIHNPMDVESFASRAEQILTSKWLYAELSEKNLNRAKNFTWDTVARQTVKFYREILGE